MKHIIVSRVNLEMDLCPSKYKDTAPYKNPEWQASRVPLLDTYARASLLKQTEPHFCFVSVWMEGTHDFGSILPNEITVTIQRTGRDDDGPLDYTGKGKQTLNYADQIRQKISEIFDPPLLVTGLDIDDCLHRDYCRILYNAVRESEFDRGKPRWWSTERRFCYNINDGRKGQKQAHSPSPFVSTYEPVTMIYPARYNHTWLPKHVPTGGNVKGLFGLQTVHNTNMFSRSVGDPADFNLEDFL